MASKFQRYATPDPEEFTFYVVVPDKAINESLTLLPGKQLHVKSSRHPATTYKEFAWAVNHEAVELGYADYTYIAAENIAQDLKAFYFARPRTQAETDHPVPFSTVWSTQSHTWDAVLEQLYFLKVTNFPQVVSSSISVFDQPRYFERRRYRPSFNRDSRIKIEQYLSNEPFTGAQLTHPQPIPTEINGTYLGLNVNFPRCLHPTIILPELLPSPQIVYGAGTIDNLPGGVPRQQVFPATNFLTNQKFVIHDVVQPVKGQFLREKVTIYPPIMQQLIEN